MSCCCMPSKAVEEEPTEAPAEVEVPAQQVPPVEEAPPPEEPRGCCAVDYAHMNSEESQPSASSEPELEPEPAIFEPISAYCEVAPQGKRCNGASEGEMVCKGLITLHQDTPELCEIRYKITGLEVGEHGFHIHEFADFSEGCKSAGPHYNPHLRQHGGPDDEERHVGDLGNIVGNADGEAEGVFEDKLIKLSGEFSVIGRSFMVHEDPDDLGLGDDTDPSGKINGQCSKVTGNAGARIACGEIMIGEPPLAPAELEQEDSGGPPTFNVGNTV